MQTSAVTLLHRRILCFHFCLAFCLAITVSPAHAQSHHAVVEGYGIGPGFSMSDGGESPIYLDGESSEVVPVGTARIGADAHGRYGVDNLHELIPSYRSAGSYPQTSGSYFWPGYYVDPDTGEGGGLTGFKLNVQWATTGPESSSDLLGIWKFYHVPDENSEGQLLLRVRIDMGYVYVKRWNDETQSYDTESYPVNTQDDSISEGADVPMEDGKVKVVYDGYMDLSTYHTDPNRYVPGSNVLYWHYEKAYSTMEVVEPPTRPDWAPPEEP